MSQLNSNSIQFLSVSFFGFSVQYWINSHLKNKLDFEDSQSTDLKQSKISGMYNWLEFLTQSRLLQETDIAKNLTAIEK